MLTRILADFGWQGDFHSHFFTAPGVDFGIYQNQPKSTCFSFYHSTPTQKTKFPTEKWNLVNSISRLNSMTPVLPKTPFGSTGTCFGPLKIQRNSVEFLR
jgi:hypothetical protein